MSHRSVRQPFNSDSYGHIISLPPPPKALPSTAATTGQWNLLNTFMILFDERNICFAFKTGETWAVEKSTGDIYTRFGVNSSGLAGLMWVTMPGVTLVDIAVGRNSVYGVDSIGTLWKFGKSCLS